MPPLEPCLCFFPFLHGLLAVSPLGLDGWHSWQLTAYLSAGLLVIESGDAPFWPEKCMSSGGNSSRDM